MTTMTIHRNDDGAFFVTLGERVADTLTYEEMLGLVAQALAPATNLADGWLRTVDEWNHCATAKFQRLAPEHEDPAEALVNRSEACLEEGDEVKHEGHRDQKVAERWHTVVHRPGCNPSLWGYVAMNHHGVTNIPRHCPPVTHFRRNGTTYRIVED